MSAALLREIELASQRHDMAVTTLCRWAVNDGTLIRRLRSGAKVGEASLVKVRRLIRMLDEAKAKRRNIQPPSRAQKPKRIRPSRVHGPADRVGTAGERFDPAHGAAEGSRALLRRQLEAGLHWIVDPALFAATCRSVGL